MIQAKIINRINFLKIALREDLEYVAKNLVIPYMIRGIDSGMAIMGGALPDNEPATIKRKGHDRQLIVSGKLRCSFFYKTFSKNKVIISISGNRKKIGGYLQNDGIKTKSVIKFYRFFGVSKDARDGAMGYIKNRIKELIGGNKK